MEQTQDTRFDPRAIKALAFDLDGTLLRPDKSVSARTLRALRSCMDQGIKLIITTGRARESGEVYRKLIGMTGPQVYYNGAEVADTEADKIIHLELLSPEPALFCVRLARERDLYYQVYFPAGIAGEGEVLMADRISEEAEQYRQSNKIPVAEGDLEEALSRPGLPGVIKGMFITAGENQEKIRPILRKRYGDSLCIVNSSPVFCETLAPGASKGTGLSRALRYLGLKPEETIAFGDEENDLPLFAAAGFSAAPANAIPKVQAAARFHIPANADDGVAVFLEEYLLAV
ncbi:MAG: HAD family hydrolase [Treponema sp.]|jgi:Cof subfamily protein (haloacid dehalogenase superfamily)|nr:HAD family hydrolase [Treponema sp.]